MAGDLFTSLRIRGKKLPNSVNFFTRTQQSISKVLPILHKVVESAKEEFADAVANGGGLYGVGYCFGAKYILMLCGELPDTVAWGQAAPGDEEQGTVKRAAVLKAGAVAHGTMVSKSDLDSVRSPVYIAAVKDDPLFPEEEVLTPGRRAIAGRKEGGR